MGIEQEIDPAGPMTPEQAAIMSHDEELYRLRERIAVLEAAVRTLVGEVRALVGAKQVADR